jgi:RecA-family ATPase
MTVMVNGTNLELDDKICVEYEEKILYNITENECKLYVESFFEKPFEEILAQFPKESIEKAIENAMLQEIEL